MVKDFNKIIRMSLHTRPKKIVVSHRLQEAALERIQFFERELEKRGLKIRLCFEQKFSIPHECEIQIHRSSRVLRGQLKSFLGLSVALDGETKRQATFGVGAACDVAPHRIAEDVARFRQEGGDYIFTNSDNRLSGLLDFRPLREESVSGPGKDPQHRITQGLHANTSLYDRKGNDLCDIPEFRRAKSKRLLNLQYHAGLAFIQDEEALKRLGSWKYMPKQIGLSDNKEHGASVLERFGLRNFNGNSAYSHEDRLPAANADPLVITAMELAAIYDLLVSHPKLKDMTTIDKKTLDNTFPKKVGAIKNALDHTIEKELGPWVDRYKQHTELRGLLGDKLYDSILQEYGKECTSR